MILSPLLNVVPVQVCWLWSCVLQTCSYQPYQPAQAFIYDLSFLSSQSVSWGRSLALLESVLQGLQRDISL